MKDSTRNSKIAAKQFHKILSQSPGLFDLLAIQEQGKMAFDGLHKRLGAMLVESILQIEREELTGPNHRPREAGFYKWGYQQGSVFIGDQKQRMRKPRFIRDGVEFTSPTYDKLKESGAFSEELLAKLMAGISARQYKSTVTKAAEAFGVSAGSVSRHFVKASAKRLKEFAERDLSGFTPFAMLIDTVHRGGVAFIVALGIDTVGDKKVLGYWEGATENSEITLKLFEDLEKRKLNLTDEVLFMTDGGSGVIKALRNKFGDKLIHQRCTIHKDRNIQKHLAKKYRKKAHTMFKDALDHATYTDAKAELLKMEKWLRGINPSAANSLLEALEEILTLHVLKVPEALRRVLKSTNGIENLFSTTRHREKNLKNYSPLYRGKPVKKDLSQRWLATVFLKAETGFRKVKGFEDIPGVILNIRKLHQEIFDNKNKLAA
jgi:transposase-like protein